jgi:hypothetical protein
MPSNGVAALPLVELEPLSAIPTHPGDPKPAATSAEPIEVRLGAAAADAAVAVGRGLADFEAIGIMRPETRELAGTTLGQVAQLLLDTPDKVDFARVHAQAKQVLYTRHGAAFQAQTDISEAKLDRGIDELIGHALEIAQKVVADERARVN